MAYTYVLTVIGDDGDIVVEHGLTTDEAVAILARGIAALKQEQTLEITPEPEPEPLKKRSRKGRKKQGKAGRYAPKPCCGSTGPRHKKDCPETGGIAHTVKAPLPASPAPEESDRLTEDQFDELKHLQEIGELRASDFAASKALPFVQVNRAIYSDTYQDYLRF